MTDFLTFCRAHGVVIDYLPPIGVWKRYKTTDKPRSRNGSVKWMGDHGFVQNHATMLDVAVWSDKTERRVNYAPVIRQAQDDTEQRQAKAAAEARDMLARAQIYHHPYLERKGFPKEVGMVLDGLLLIPMRFKGEVVGLQRIAEDGSKKFLFGQRSAGAAHTFKAGLHGPQILCEGYATALSIKAAMASIGGPYAIHVAFSAQNIVKLAEGLPKAVVVADNDQSGTGKAVARKTGLRWWMPPEVGMDANDYHQAKGLFGLSVALRQMIF